MSYQTVYCVETFRRQGRGLERAALRSFMTKGEALEVGRLLRPTAVGVLVYSVEIDAAASLSGHVSVLARRGEVPALAY